MKIAVPKELHDGENRVAMSPDMASRLVKMGHEVILETGAGVRATLPNELYEKAGALIGKDANETYSGADIVLKVRPPIANDQGTDELAMLAAEAAAEHGAGCLDAEHRRQRVDHELRVLHVVRDDARLARDVLEPHLEQLLEDGHEHGRGAALQLGKGRDRLRVDAQLQEQVVGVVHDALGGLSVQHEGGGRAALVAVGPKGQGNAAASKAWPQVAALDADQIPNLLSAMNKANGLGQNWLRAAVDAIVAEREANGEFHSLNEFCRRCLLYTSPSPRDGLLSPMPA